MFEERRPIVRRKRLRVGAERLLVMRGPWARVRDLVVPRLRLRLLRRAGQVRGPHVLEACAVHLARDRAALREIYVEVGHGQIVLRVVLVVLGIDRRGRGRFVYGRRRKLLWRGMGRHKHSEVGQRRR